MADKRGELQGWAATFLWGLAGGLFAGFCYTFMGFVSVLTGHGHAPEQTRPILWSIFKGYMGAGLLGGLILGVGRRFATTENRARVLGAVVGLTAAVPISSIFLGPFALWEGRG